MFEYPVKLHYSINSNKNKCILKSENGQTLYFKDIYKLCI